MTDPRYAKLASNLINHSIHLEKGEKVLIEAFDLRAGGARHPERHRQHRHRARGTSDTSVHTSAAIPSGGRVASRTCTSRQEVEVPTTQGYTD